jgi:hypothetical protein
LPILYDCSLLCTMCRFSTSSFSAAHGRGWKLPSDAAPRTRVGNGRSGWSTSSCKVLSSAGEVSLRWPLLLARTSQRTPGFPSRRFKRSCCWCNSGIFWFKGRKRFGIFWYIHYDQLKCERERHIMNWTLHALFRFRRQKPSLIGQPILMTYPCFEPRGYIPSFPELSWPLCSHDLGAAQASCPGDALKKTLSSSNNHWQPWIIQNSWLDKSHPPSFTGWIRQLPGRMTKISHS